MLRLRHLLIAIIVLLLILVSFFIDLHMDAKVYIYQQREYQFDIEDDSTIAVYGENGVRYLGIVNIRNSPLDSVLIKDNE